MSQKFGNNLRFLGLQPGVFYLTKALCSNQALGKSHAFVYKLPLNTSIFILFSIGTSKRLNDKVQKKNAFYAAKYFKLLSSKYGYSQRNTELANSLKGMLMC